MTDHICCHEKLLVYKYALTYLRMRKSSYARVAKKYGVPQKDVERALKVTLPKISLWLSDKVSQKARKNSTRALKEINAKK